MPRTQDKKGERRGKRGRTRRSERGTMRQSHKHLLELACFADHENYGLHVRQSFELIQYASLRSHGGLSPNKNGTKSSSSQKYFWDVPNTNFGRGASHPTQNGTRSSSSKRCFLDEELLGPKICQASGAPYPKSLFGARISSAQQSVWDEELLVP